MKLNKVVNTAYVVCCFLMIIASTYSIKVNYERAQQNKEFRVIIQGYTESNDRYEKILDDQQKLIDERRESNERFNNMIDQIKERLK